MTKEMMMEKVIRMFGFEHELTQWFFAAVEAEGDDIRNVIVAYNYCVDQYESEVE